MDASALIVKRATDVELSKPMYMANAWWIRGEIEGRGSGAICLTGGHAGEWSAVDQEQVVTLSENWSWYPDLPKLAIPTGGRCPIGSIVLSRGGPIVVGNGCAVLLSTGAIQFNQANGLHYPQWTAIAHRAESPFDRQELFEVTGGALATNINVRFP